MKKAPFVLSAWLRRALPKQPRVLRLWLLRALLLFCGAIGLTACSKSSPERRQLESRPLFIALERDFQDFRSWGSVELKAPEASEAHPAGPQRT